jgi:hypothetical protein
MDARKLRAKGYTIEKPLKTANGAREPTLVAWANA